MFLIVALQVWGRYLRAMGGKSGSQLEANLKDLTILWLQLHMNTHEYLWIYTYEFAYFFYANFYASIHGFWGAMPLLSGSASQEYEDIHPPKGVPNYKAAAEVVKPWEVH